MFLEERARSRTSVTLLVHPKSLRRSCDGYDPLAGDIYFASGFGRSPSFGSSSFGSEALTLLLSIMPAA